MGESVALLEDAFPSQIRPGLRTVLSMLPAAMHPAHGSITGGTEGRWPELSVCGELVRIPARIYNREPSAEVIAGFTEEQRAIVACLYTRHHDGFVRQKWLAEVLTEQNCWSAPFVVQLCGEYVVQICQDIAEFALKVLPVRPELRPYYGDFFRSNPVFVQLTAARAVSYWNEYYRRSGTERSAYPGLVALQALLFEAAS